MEHQNSDLLDKGKTGLKIRLISAIIDLSLYVFSVFSHSE